MVFSDTTNKDGLIQDCEFLLNMGDATISGDSSSAALLKVFTRLINQRLHNTISTIFQSQDGWDWDDKNNGRYPIATRSLIANQQDYTFGTALWSLLTQEGATSNPTVTIATPGVFTLTNHGLQVNDTVQFTTTGALPTGLTVGTTYYIIAAGLTSSTFEVSTTLGGSAVNTSGTQSGTHSMTQNLSPLKIDRVEISYDAGSTWSRCMPFDINQTDYPTDATSVGNNFIKTSPFYDIQFNALRLYPIPTASSANGLKIWFYRAPIQFLSTDTAKNPPIDAPFHRILSIGAALDFAAAKSMPQVQFLAAMLNDLEEKMKVYYGSKDVDRRLVLGSIYDTNYGS